MMILSFRHKKSFEDLLDKAKGAYEEIAEVIECLEEAHEAHEEEDESYYSERRGGRTSMRGRYGYRR